MGGAQDMDFPRRPGPAIFAGGLGFVFTVVFLWLAAAAGTWWGTERLIAVFKQFDAKVPAATVWWIRTYPALAAGCGAMAAALAAKEFLPVSRVGKATANLGALALWLLWLGAFAVAMGLPFAAIMQSLAGGASGSSPGSP